MELPLEAVTRLIPVLCAHQLAGVPELPVAWQDFGCAVLPALMQNGDETCSEQLCRCQTRLCAAPYGVTAVSVAAGGCVPDDNGRQGDLAVRDGVLQHTARLVA